jgi:hypothetical protein
MYQTTSFDRAPSGNLRDHEENGRPETPVPYRRDGYDTRTLPFHTIRQFLEIEAKAKEPWTGFSAPFSYRNEFHVETFTVLEPI